MNSSSLFRISAITLLGIVVFLGAAISPAWAQSTGNLVGTVRDESGGVVPAATVSLFRQGMTEPAFQTLTNNEGFFVFRSLQPESYRIKIEKQGFAAYEPSNVVTLAPGTETPLNDLVLKVGAQAAGTTVAEPNVAVQSSNAEVSANLTTAQLDTLPILDRDPLDLVLTQAGVVSGGGAYTTIDGLRTSLSNVTLDGINIQDNTVRYNGLNFVENNLILGQVSQFTLVTSNQAATYGNGITQTAFVTPSGTNELHGSAFYLNSNNPMNANAWGQNQSGLKDEYKSNQGGFTLGGPLIKNKLFGYAGYELLREPNTIGFSAVTLPPGIVQQLLPGVTLNPIVSSLLSQIPAPNTNETTYEHAETQQILWDNAIARLDYTPSQRNTFVASYLWNRDNVDNGASRYGPQFALAQYERANFASGAWRSMVTPHFTNEVRAGVDISNVAFVNREATEPYILDLGVFENLNPVDSTRPQGRTLKTIDFQDNASLLLGRHNLQFGVQAQLIRIDSYLFGYNVPTLYLGDGSNSGDFSDLMALATGSAYRVDQYFFPANSSGAFAAVPEQNRLALDNYAAYVQDTWKVNARLVLTAGLRFEHYSTLRDNSGLFYTPLLVNGDLAETFASGSPSYGPQGGGYYPNMNNVGPSIGVAFDPKGRGKTVFRAAYGIGYVNDDFAEALRRTLSENAFSNSVIDLSLGESVNFPNSLVLSPPAVQNLSPFISVPTSGYGTTSPGGGVIGLIDPRLRAPYVEQWSAGVQQEMRGMIFDLRYVGNHAVRLLRQDELWAANTAGYFNDVYYTSNSSSSTYNALQVDVSRRFRRDLQFQANYTFSKALTDSNTFTSAFVDPYRDPSNHSLDKGPAVFDVRNAFKVNLTYDLPLARGTSGPVRAVIGGWSISAIAVAQSGEPFSILSGICDPGCQTATATVGGSALSQIVSYHMTGNGPSIINTATPSQVFLAAPYGTPGALGSRSFYGPATYDIDLGIQKRFRITERQSLELRGVAINALNHPSFGFYNQNVYSSCTTYTSCTVNSSFGQSAYALYPPRTVQLSAYYHF